MEQLELARKQLLRYVQPRLVWEVTLMNLLESLGDSEIAGHRN